VAVFYGSTKPRHEVCTDSLQGAVKVSGSGFDSGYAICGIFFSSSSPSWPLLSPKRGAARRPCTTQVREHTPFEEKIAENAASRPNFGDFFGWRAPPPAARRHAWADGGYFGYWRGRSHWSRLSRSWSSRSSSWDLRGEVVVMVLVVVIAGDGAASAVSVDRERDVPRPRPRAAPPPRGRRVRASRSVPPAFS